MKLPKVYRQDSNIYGETYITVNGEYLPIIRYHELYGACAEDLALTILADYFEEEPTQYQLDQGKGKCWKLHKDFAREVVSNWGYGLIWSQDIKLWIDFFSNKENSGIDLIKLFGPMSFIRTMLEDTERKVYHLVRDIDDSIDIDANDHILEQIRYHQLSDDFCVEDMALTILADYFGEKPTREQFERGESKCWELHIDFANEMLPKREMVVFGDQIKTWIDQHIGKAILENELTKMLRNLRGSIIILKEENNYTWKIFNKNGNSHSFIDAVQRAIESLINAAPPQ